MPTTNSTAVFMGAGTSKPFGHPLTSEILPRIWQLLKRGELFKHDAGENEFFRKWLLRLLPGLPDISPDNFPLVTNVLSVVDGAIDSGLVPIPSLDLTSLLRFRALFEWAICDAIHRDSETPEQRKALVAFSDWLAKLRGESEPLTLITTNYDITVEEQLYDSYYQDMASRKRALAEDTDPEWQSSYDAHGAIARDFDFGFSWRAPLDDDGRLFERAIHPRVRFYKLHGSLNWLRCDVCDHLYINPDWAINEIIYERPSSWNTCECGRNARLRPVIVAPSFVRKMRDTNLGQVWRHSVEALRKADRWIIIGYSFPDEDVSIRSLLMRGYHSRSKPPRVVIVARDNKRALKERYLCHFPNAEFHTQGLIKALPRL